MAQTTITAAEQNWYRNNIGAQSVQAEQKMREYADYLIRKNMHDGTLDIPQLRNDVISAVVANMGVYGTNAKVIANQYFDYLMEKQGSNVKSKIYDTTEIDMIESQVRYLIQYAVDKDYDTFVDKIGDYANFLTWRNGWDNLINNCKNTGVRYARVPSGGKTCAFCLMLASRGFVYHSEASAGMFNDYHSNCRCNVIPCPNKESDPKVYGYDLDKYREIYEKARENADKDPANYVDGDTHRRAILREIKKINPPGKE